MRLQRTTQKVIYVSIDRFTTSVNMIFNSMKHFDSIFSFHKRFEKNGRPNISRSI
jgi:hypothetical protein